MNEPRVVYLTSKRFPPTTADHAYVGSLARGFARLLGGRFLLTITSRPSPDLEGIRTHTVTLPIRFARTAYFSLWFPFFVTKRGYRGSDTVLFSNEQHLLSVAIFWRPLLRARYRICSDWHLMTETWRDQYVANGSDFLITTSERLKDRIVEKTGVHESKVRVVYGGVDFSPYAEPLPTRQDLSLPSDRFIIGYVGLFTSLGHSKGLATLIDALRHLPDDVVAAFVGGNEAEIQAYKDYAEKRGVLARTYWIRRQPLNRVPSYARSMDALVIPYPDTKHFRDYGFPMKVYEYLAAAKPIIYSNLAILDEVLAGKGISFTADDPESLARAVNAIRSGEGTNTSTRNDLARYSWDAKAGAIYSLFN